jgi:hypothetical protein
VSDDPISGCGAASPRQVFLFAGHMVDAPDRATPRFPGRQGCGGEQRIGAALDACSAGPADLA